MAEDRNVLILFKPGMSVLDQSMLALRIHMNWQRCEDVNVDDQVDRIAVWGDLGDLADDWIESLNKSDYLIAIETEGALPKTLAYEIELEYAMMDGAQRPSIRFKDPADVAFVKQFCPEISDNLSSTVAVGEGPDENGEYSVISVDGVLAEASLNLKDKLLTIFPTWEGHKRFLDNDRLLEYDE